MRCTYILERHGLCLCYYYCDYLHLRSICAQKSSFDCFIVYYFWASRNCQSIVRGQDSIPAIITIIQNFFSVCQNLNDSNYYHSGSSKVSTDSSLALSRKHLETIAVRLSVGRASSVTHSSVSNKDVISLQKADPLFIWFIISQLEVNIQVQGSLKLNQLSTSIKNYFSLINCSPLLPFNEFYLSM